MNLKLKDRISLFRDFFTATPLQLCVAGRAGLHAALTVPNFLAFIIFGGLHE